MYAQRARRILVASAHDGSQEVPVCDHSTHLLRQDPYQVVLGRRQMHRLAGSLDPASDQVDFDIGNADERL